MATPTPAIPTFTDGSVVHATDLNASLTTLGPETVAEAEGLAASVLAPVHAADPVAALADVLKPE
jgi:hypothetical protein